MAAVRRCFIISPIGSENSAIRQHADDVFDFIIKPAVEECGLEALRSDHLLEPGRVTEQMFREILQSDCCIAVLTGYNPNVFYELAIAQTAGTPAVILMEKGHELPFDIKDLRCVPYDLAARSVIDRRYVKQVVAHLKSVEAAGWKAVPPFADLPLLLLERRGLPRSLLEELTAPLGVKRQVLFPHQESLLFRIEQLCRATGRVSQHDIGRALGKPHDDAETYHRLERLRLLGFIEKIRAADHSFSYRLTPAAQALQSHAT